MDSDALTIPIYLDTNTLLDLLASIQDGFSIVENVTSRTSDKDTKEDMKTLKGNVGFGVANVLDIFKIDLSGSAKKTDEKQAGEEHSSTKYHTYGSLLNRLRLKIKEAGLLKIITDEKSWDSVNAPDFVEISGTFMPSPLYDSVQRIYKLINLFTVFSAFAQSNPTALNPQTVTKSEKGTPQKGTPQKGTPQKNMTNQLKDIKTFLDGFIKDLEPEGTQTYIIKLSGLEDYKIVVSLLKDYNRDRSNLELPYGNFRMLGKVVRKVNKDESIDLLRGTGLSGMNDAMLIQILSGFEQLGEHGLKSDEKIITKINAPAMQIIPIAIYV